MVLTTGEDECLDCPSPEVVDTIIVNENTTDCPHCPTPVRADS